MKSLTHITQHSEYLPFGELLVDEHRNSHNTRYKFNGKEFDQETGNYYYGARYYNPKTSLWLSVDPLAEKYNEWSPYNYTLNNPVKYVDPDGRSVDEPDDWVLGKNGKYIYDADVTSALDPDLSGRIYVGKSLDDVAENYSNNNPISSFLGGEPEFGDTSDWQGEIKADLKNWVDDWADSDNFLSELSYTSVNEGSLTFQAMNPFDNRVTTLQGHGVNSRELTDAGANTFASMIPLSKPANQTIKVLNASQFSKTFKNTFLTKTSHKLIGFYNRTYNKIADNFNESTFFKSTTENITSFFFENDNN